MGVLLGTVTQVRKRKAHVIMWEQSPKNILMSADRPISCRKGLSHKPLRSMKAVLRVRWGKAA